MSDTKLGQLINVINAERDAIHVAIAPVVAGQPLMPGDHIGFLPDGTVGEIENSIGIVDPFLKKRVHTGDKFYLCLYQQTVTGMRHHWNHPAFPWEQKPAPEPPLVEKELTPKEKAEKWIADYCATIPASPAEIMEAAQEWIESGEFLCQGGRFQGEDVPDEFWTHYETITGEKGNGSFFSCSC